MKCMYIRCSTAEQNEARQITLANNSGVEKIFIEKKSGKDRNRPELEKMLNYIREGDTVIVESISRIARNTKDLLSIIDEINKKNANFISLKENIDTTTPAGKFMLTVFGALAELERENILQRQAEGIAEAKQNKVYKGRKAKPIDEKKFKKMCDEWYNGKITAMSICREFGFTSPTFYKKVNERGYKKPNNGFKTPLQK